MTSNGQVLHSSRRTRVLRVPWAGAPGGTAIRKEVLDADGPVRLRREVVVLSRLAGIEGVPEVLESSPEGTWVVLSDCGGSVLAGQVPPGGFDPTWVVRFARALTVVVAGVHRAGVVHKDINPANLVLAGDPDRPVVELIDFDLASTFAEELPGFTHHRAIAGTLPYLAPEQSGRTGAPVDHRADLYAIGATLYELLTGCPPFGADTEDPLRLVHAHLAQLPKPPAELAPAVPAELSAIVLRLLAKEPDRRYQSAEGLRHDLARLEARLATPGDGASGGFPLGERDFPLRLAAPSRLVGRDGEIDLLRQAYTEARDGVRGLLVSGGPGVGKTVLLDQLRSLVTAHGGWFVSGKFDQFRRDRDADAVGQALRALGRLLLAEPDAELAILREALLAALGPNAGLLAAMPEFGTLLGIAPDEQTGDLAQQGARLYRGNLDLLRTVASPSRPVVIVLDDLQWATAFPIGFVDAVLTDEALSGVLIVGAYRDGEVDAAHPLSGVLARWQRLGVAPAQLRLANLPPAELTALLAQMLRLPPDRTAALAEAVGERTAGNPYDTVELINALRSDGVLTLGDDGWSWDAAAIRRFVGNGEVVDLLATRIDRLPPASQTLLETMACLGGELEVARLAEAAGLGERDTREALAPALEDGLLAAAVADSGEYLVARFRHDRVQQAAYARHPGDARALLHRTLARRLVGVPGSAGMAAEQYLHAVDTLTDTDELRRAAELFLATALEVQLINTTLAGRLLTAASSALTVAGAAPGDALRQAVRHARHATAYLLGHLEEADEIYQDIVSHSTDVLDLVGPTELQISSLTNRRQYREALNLGLGLLARFGVEVPTPEQLGPQIGAGLRALRAWVEEGDLAFDVSRPELTEPRLVMTARLINRLLPPSFYCDHVVLGWLTLTARSLWADHGPCSHLAGAVAHAGALTIAVLDDYATGYRTVRRILAVSEARGYTEVTPQVRFLLTMCSSPWFEPLETVAQDAAAAFEGSLRRGDLHHANYSNNSRLMVTLEFAPRLEDFLTDVESTLNFAARAGHESASEAQVMLRQFARAMRGETIAPGSLTGEGYDETEREAAFAGDPVQVNVLHTGRALSAAIFADVPALVRHAQLAMDAAPSGPGAYLTCLSRVVAGMAFAQSLRTAATDDERARTLAGLDAVRDWLALRAQDAPMNVGHLLALVDAERAWAVGDTWAAAQAFDEGIRQLESRTRPWAQALITERAGLLHTERGLEHTGRALLAEARGHYARWGATGKVRELDQRYPYLRGLAERSAGGPGGSTLRGASSGHSHHGTLVVTSDDIDLVGVLRASAALSSETNTDRLRDRVVDVLTLMTGATGVHLALWDDASKDWFLQTADGAERLAVGQAGARGLLPLSAFRYAERTRQPLNVEDATRDDRFARDPALAGLDCCSLLVVPVQGQGATRAILLLENRVHRGAFSADRLDAVLLIAGQLAVCLEQALAERFRSLVQRSSELTLVCDSAGIISYASTASVELLGVPEVALIGRPVTTLVQPGDRDALAAWLDPAAGTRAPGRDAHGPREALVCRLADAEREPRWVEVTLTDLSADPAVGGLMLRLRDVTERRRLEVELRHAQKLESVGQLASGIAHEINTPIQFIDSNVRFLTDAFADLAGLLRAAPASAATASAPPTAVDVDDLLEEIPQALRDTLDGAVRVAGIVRAMKAFGHPGGDTKSYADLNEAVRNTLVVAGSEIRPVADAVTDLGDLPPVWCHLADINQVLLNLVVNAAHAMAAQQATGGGRGTLTVRTRQDGEDILLEVSDTGTGIPPEIADRVFDQFFTTKEVGKGTGQGLALAHTIVHERHAGSLTFKSAPGTGTTFRVRLPNPTQGGHSAPQ